MNNKPKISLIFFATAMMVLMVFSSISVGCGDPPPPDEQIRCEYDLIAGQDFDTPAGTVIIREMENDGRHEIWVTFQTEGGWYLDETHVHLTDDYIGDGSSYEWDDWNWGGAVGNNGNPKPGKFDYSMDHGTGVTTYTHEIDIGAWDGTLLNPWEYAIAAHAVVYRGSDVTYQEETGWGEGKKFPKSWAMFMLFPCKKVPSFVESATFKGYHSGSSSSSDAYWNFNFYGITPDEGDQLVNGWYEGWCMEENVNMYQNTEYTATFYASLDPALPLAYDTVNGNWNMVNWIINHKYDYLDNDYNRAQVQGAIWYFTEGKSYGSNTWIAQIVSDAIANGENFWPTTGQFMAIIMDNDIGSTNIQGTFFELDP